MESLAPLNNATSDPHVKICVVGPVPIWNTTLLNIARNVAENKEIFQTIDVHVPLSQENIWPKCFGVDGANLPKNINPVVNMVEMVGDANILIIATPIDEIEGICDQLSHHVKEGSVALLLHGGILNNHGRFNLASSVVRDKLKIPCYTYSGNHNKGVLGCPNPKHAELFSYLLSNDNFTIHVTKDTESVEVCGVLKEILDICNGVCSGLHISDSTRTQLMLQGLNEMIAFVKETSKIDLVPSIIECQGISSLFNFSNNNISSKLVHQMVETNTPLSLLEKQFLGGTKVLGRTSAENLVSLIRHYKMEKEFPLVTAIHGIYSNLIKEKHLHNKLPASSDLDGEKETLLEVDVYNNCKIPFPLFEKCNVGMLFRGMIVPCILDNRPMRSFSTKNFERRYSKSSDRIDDVENKTKRLKSSSSNFENEEKLSMESKVCKRFMDPSVFSAINTKKFLSSRKPIKGWRNLIVHNGGVPGKMAGNAETQKPLLNNFAIERIENYSSSDDPSYDRFSSKPSPDEVLEKVKFLLKRAQALSFDLVVAKHFAEKALKVQDKVFADNVRKLKLPERREKSTTTISRTQAFSNQGNTIRSDDGPSEDPSKPVIGRYETASEEIDVVDDFINDKVLGNEKKLKPKREYIRDPEERKKKHIESRDPTVWTEYLKKMHQRYLKNNEAKKSKETKKVEELESNMKTQKPTDLFNQSQRTRRGRLDNTKTSGNTDKYTNTKAMDESKNEVGFADRIKMMNEELDTAGKLVNLLEKKALETKTLIENAITSQDELTKAKTIEAETQPKTIEGSASKISGEDSAQRGPKKIESSVYNTFETNSEQRGPKKIESSAYKTSGTKKIEGSASKNSGANSAQKGSAKKLPRKLKLKDCCQPKANITFKPPKFFHTMASNLSDKHQKPRFPETDMNIRSSSMNSTLSNQKTFDSNAGIILGKLEFSSPFTKNCIIKIASNEFNSSLSGMFSKIAFTTLRSLKHLRR